MKITTKEVVEINKRFGGSLRSDSSLKFAESLAENTESTYRHAAIWARAIIVDHPFTDANKRTAFYAIGRQIEIKNEERIIDAMIRIASKNIADLKKIEEMFKNANR